MTSCTTRLKCGCPIQCSTLDCMVQSSPIQQIATLHAAHRGGGRVHPGSCEEVVQDRDFMALLHQPVNQVAPAYPGPQTFTLHANLHRALLRVFTSMRSIDLPTVGGHPTKPAPPVTKIRLRCPRGRSRTPTCPTPADKRASDSFWSRATLSSLVTTRIRRSTCTKPAM